MSSLDQEQEYFLCYLFGDLGRAAHMQCKAINRTLPPPVQRGESLFLASQCLREQLFVGWFV